MWRLSVWVRGWYVAGGASVSERDLREDLPTFVLDILVQVVLPVVYFGIRLMQVSASKDAILGKRPWKTSLSFLVTNSSIVYV